MKHTTIVVAVGFAFVVALPSVPAMALTGRSFVSPTGSDGNPCTLALPCRNLQAALNQTNPGGEIAVLGTAGYSGGATLTIDRAISIVNPGAFEAGISPPSGGNGIVINVGPTDAVSLRGLTIEGGGVGQTGIVFNGGKSLTIDNCVIRHLTSSGIAFAPSALAKLIVSNTELSDNGGDGAYLQPTGSANANAVFDHVKANNNVQHGIAAFANLTTGYVKVAISDSTAAHNGNYGFAASTDASQPGQGGGSINIVQCRLGLQPCRHLFKCQWRDNYAPPFSGDGERYCMASHRV